MLSINSRNNEYMSAKQLADWLGISERSIRSYTSRGLLPFIRIGRRVIYRREAVANKLLELEVKTKK